jgi:hypothetical protein
MSHNEDWSPDEALGTETFEQGDEALDEASRIDPELDELVDLDPSLDPGRLVDERELDEVGATLDDPEDLVTLDGGIDDPDGREEPRDRAERGDDDEGWDLDAR